jgi:hypothetical protein
LDLRIEALLSIQRALWEKVTPDLRAVAMLIDGDAASGHVSARFLYEGAAGEVQRECVSIAEAEFAADFSQAISTDFVAVEDVAERKLASGEEWVYLRWEPPR